jgi:alanine dehydrogenase
MRIAASLGPGDADRLLTPGLVVGWVERVLSSGDAVEAPRVSLESGGSWLGLMAASGFGRHVVKVVGVYPGNPPRGLPLVRGILVSIDSETGDTVLWAPAEEPTGWRTAAASALALKLMGYRGGGVLGVIGAGVQARYHLRVLTELYSPEEVLVNSRRRWGAEELAREYGGRYAELDSLLSRSDVVVAATNSREPVVRGDLKSGAFIVSVGAPRPVREISDEILEKAGCVLTDSPIAAEESDDAARARELVTLREALRGRECRQGEYRVYKSVGTPLLDLAAALALEEALRAARKG